MGEELLAIATTLKRWPANSRRAIDAQEPDDLPHPAGSGGRSANLPELEQNIHHCIDDRGDVADRASAKLGGIRSKLKTIRSSIRERLQRILQRQAGAVPGTVD